VSSTRRVPKAVKKYVSKAIKGKIENRERYGSQAVNVFNAFDWGYTVMNPLWGIAQGTGETNFTGNDYYLKNITLNVFAESVYAKDMVLQFALISGPNLVSAAAWTNFLPPNDVFQLTATAGELWVVDPAKYRILRTGKINLKRSGFTGTMSRHGRLSVNVNKKICVNPTTGLIKSGKQLSLIMWATVSGGTVALERVSTTTTVKVTFKDV